MPIQIRNDLLVIDDSSFPYILEQNVTIVLKSFQGLVRCNIYRPKEQERVPVLVTYGPYGKTSITRSKCRLLQTLRVYESTDIHEAFMRNHSRRSTNDISRFILLLRPLTQASGLQMAMLFCEPMKWVLVSLLESWTLCQSPRVMRLRM